jgi:hypothetical protein
MAHTDTKTTARTAQPGAAWARTREAVAWSVVAAGVLLGAMWGSGTLTSSETAHATVTAQTVAEPRHYGDGYVTTEISYTDTNGTRRSGSVPGAVPADSTVEVHLDSSGQVIPTPAQQHEQVVGGVVGALVGGIVALALALFGYANAERYLNKR